jgi:predicted ATPase/class 3 adenylate cyclase
LATRTQPLPTGTVTFFFSDIEASTRLLQRLGDRYAAVLERHAVIIRTALAEHHGIEISNEGDGFFAVFTLARHATACAVAVQRAMFDEPWPGDGPVRVRIGLHTGEGTLRGPDAYVGIDLHRAARIGGCGHGGQTLLSSEAADLADRVLPPGSHLVDLGRHELKDLAYPEHLYQLSVDGLPGEFPPLRTSIVATDNLPGRDSTFIGRTTETEALASALGDHRLITLTGAAGVGKTSLSIHAAADLRSRFPDGTWMVEIARLTDGDQIASAVARELNLTEPPVESVSRMLAKRLSHASLLLVLDGCEHLVAEVAGFVDGLLGATAAVHVLVTSREPLALGAEHLVRLSPLSVPPSGVVAQDALATYDAVALLAERATVVRPEIRLDADAYETIARIVRRLDGLPLAIELAAAQLKMLSLRQIEERLGHEFAGIGASRRDALPHHRTLGTTLDWSYDSLEARERTLLGRLSVFAGSFTLDAVEEVCCAGSVEQGTVVDVLGRLVDTSLVTVIAADPVRYRLLEPIAQYARSKLPELEDPAAARSAHARHYLRLAEEADRGLLGKDQVAWIHRLDLERYNLLAALAWMHGTGDSHGVLQMAAALRVVWLLRRDVTEGGRWLETALEARAGAPTGTVIRALNGAALLAMRRLDFDRARQWLDEGLQLSRAAGDVTAAAVQQAGLALLAWYGDDDETRADSLAAEVLDDDPDWWTRSWMLAMRGTLARVRGDHEAAGVFFDGSHRLLTERGGSFDLGWSFLRLGTLAKDRGHYAEATRRLQEGRILLAEARDPIGQAHADAGLGALAWLRGDRDQAMSLYRSVLADFGRGEQVADNLFELRMMLQGRVSLEQLRLIAEWNQERAKQGDRGVRAALAEHLFHLGKTAFRRGELERAKKALGESLVLSDAAEDYRGVAIALIALGRVHAADDDMTEAARYLAHASAVADADGLSPWPPLDEPDYEQHVVEVREHLEAPAFEKAWHEGRAMTLHEAIAGTGVRLL